MVLYKRAAFFAARLQRLQSRCVSTSSNPYPYPAKPNPSAHEIFHLPHGASRSDVKTRYYDLVRIYHPDSPASRSVPPETAHARFQAIGAAYATLSGKPQLLREGGSEAESFARGGQHDINAAMWRARQRKRAELDIGLDDRWKDRMMLGTILLAVGMFVFQTWSSRRQAMQEAAERSQRPYTFTALASKEQVQEKTRAPDDHEHDVLAAPGPGKPIA